MSAVLGSQSDSSPKKFSKRADIQGLRAFSVLVVIAFHAGLPVPGGFIGVDVFFVISGFVITGMLQREWIRTSRISLRTFYARRFKRLVPALALTVSATMVLSSLLLSPFGIQQLAAKTGVGTMLFGSNLVIATSSGNYFDTQAELNPLLNMWSLSVEEQFYFFFPIVLLLAWVLLRNRHSKFWLVYVVVIITLLVSFLIAINEGLKISYLGNLLTGFYSPLSRAWEFAIGALLALIISKLKPTYSNTFVSNLFGIVGAFLLLASLWLISGSTPFPGYWTLLPVTGAILVIAAGSIGNGFTVRFWEVKPLGVVGDLSYSLYLWHWPLIAVAVVLWPLSPWAGFIAALFAVIPSFLSYKYVEQPNRSKQFHSKRRALRFGIIVMVVPLLLSIVTLFEANHFWLPKYESGALSTYPQTIGVADAITLEKDDVYPCANSELQEQAFINNGEPMCFQSKPGPVVDVALVGDSHSAHLFIGFAQALPNLNVASYFWPSQPVPSESHFAKIYSAIEKSPSVKTVIINSAWIKRGVLLEEMRTEIATLINTGKKVYVTDDIPEFPFDATICKYRKAPILPWNECGMPSKNNAEETQLSQLALVELQRTTPGLITLASMKYFCDEDRCSMVNNGELMYSDTQHLNHAGSTYLAQRLIDSDPWLRNLR